MYLILRGPVMEQTSLLTFIYKKFEQLLGRIKAKYINTKKNSLYYPFKALGWTFQVY